MNNSEVESPPETFVELRIPVPRFYKNLLQASGARDERMAVLVSSRAHVVKKALTSEPTTRKEKREQRRVKDSFYKSLSYTKGLLADLTQGGTRPANEEIVLNLVPSVLQDLDEIGQISQQGKLATLALIPWRSAAMVLNLDEFLLTF